MKYLLTLLLVFVISSVFSQKQGNIDAEGSKVKSFFSLIFEQSNKKKVRKNRCPKISRENSKASKQVRNKHYKLQTKTVKRRMKKSKKKAENHNKGRIPLMVKIKKKLDGRVY